MTIIRNSFSLLIVILCTLYSLSATSNENVVVIVNKNNVNTIDRNLIINIYTGSIKNWPDGSPIYALDQDSNSLVRNNFYKTIIKKSTITIRAIRAKNIFTGRSVPPKVVSPDKEIKNIISNNENAIGYIISTSIDESIKVISSHLE